MGADPITVQGLSDLTGDSARWSTATLYIGVEGCCWRSLSEDFGPWQTVCGYQDRFRHDGAWADVAVPLVPAARARFGKAPVPSTGIAGAWSITSRPQKGKRGVDAYKEVGSIKCYLLTCSFNFCLAVLVPAINLHDTHGLEPLLERAAETGRDLRRVKVGTSTPARQFGQPPSGTPSTFQVPLRDPTTRGFASLPVRWRIEATFGTLSNCYRRLTRNLEQSAEAPRT